MTIGKSIKKYRTNRGIQRKKFANMVGISDFSIGNIEHGYKLPKWSNLMKIMKELKIEHMRKQFARQLLKERLTRDEFEYFFE